MQAAAADLQDSLKTSVVRLASKCSKAVKGSPIPFRELPNDLCASSATSIAVFPFLAIGLLPGSGWPSSKANSWHSYRKAVMSGLTYYGFATQGIVGEEAPFPTSDFLPNLKQDWKDYFRDCVQTTDGIVKGSEFKSYRDLIKRLCFKTEEPGPHLRRLLIRSLMVVHFLGRTFSGALIYFVLDRIFNARATMEPGSPTSPGRAAKIETHIVPRSLEALPIELYCVHETDADDSQEGTSARRLVVRGSSALIFSLEANKSSLAHINARVTLDIPDLNAFGADEVVDKIGALVGIDSSSMTDMWPSADSPIFSPMQVAVLDPEVLKELGSVLRVTVRTAPRLQSHP
eukprot:Blabericola_migrator_1__3490@NODE_2032_length_3387_cov_46_953012_g1274_i1_p2_GENE_NODE_2032_length_3387_cov_46_953012_g1274_i1NODE_2032_length_3387_cov_46_953012_g1274_i1_p2_ORF_typecomplete_len366_score42_39_NODE_2032_length_3387_cov_46_953012_g1274_i122893323